MSDSLKKFFFVAGLIVFAGFVQFLVQVAFVGYLGNTEEAEIPVVARVLD